MAFVNHLELGSLRVQDRRMLQEEFKRQHISNDPEEVLASLELVVYDAEYANKAKQRSESKA